MWDGEEGRVVYREESSFCDLKDVFNLKKTLKLDIPTGGDNFSTRTIERNLDYYALVENEQKSILCIFPNTYKGWEKIKQECPYLSEDDIIKLSEYHATTDGAYYLKYVEEDVFVEEFL